MVRKFCRWYCVWYRLVVVEFGFVDYGFEGFG